MKKNKEFELKAYCFRCGSFDIELKDGWNVCKHCGALSKIEGNELNIKIKAKSTK